MRDKIQNLLHIYQTKLNQVYAKHYQKIGLSVDSPDLEEIILTDRQTHDIDRLQGIVNSLEIALQRCPSAPEPSQKYEVKIESGRKSVAVTDRQRAKKLQEHYAKQRYVPSIMK
ncbi:MAG: hypothetical protein V2I97_15975 [Desulfococcaceae bacterium]|jgi:hypothetical protein|nr:hypothetical protein [Desulfococcaceae bacterium]